jgi:hypothetical protein
VLRILVFTPLEIPQAVVVGGPGLLGARVDLVELTGYLFVGKGRHSIHRTPNIRPWIITPESSVALERQLHHLGLDAVLAHLNGVPGGRLPANQRERNRPVCRGNAG